MSNVSKGLFAEDLACKYLNEKGCRILDRNFHTQHGEVDIVFEEDGRLVFCEVKAKYLGGHGMPEEEFGRVKFERFNSAVLDYLSRTDVDTDDYRIDLIAMQMDVATKTCRLKHYKAYY